MTYRGMFKEYPKSFPALLQLSLCPDPGGYITKAVYCPDNMSVTLLGENKYLDHFSVRTMKGMSSKGSWLIPGLSNL